MVASAQSDTSTWVRLDHHSLGMPVPAVFMPLSDLIGLDLVRLGFVSVVAQDEQEDIPTSQWLAANLASPERLTMLVFDHKLPLRPKSLLKLRPVHRFEGRYAAAADSGWQNEVRTAARILAVARPRPDPQHDEDLAGALRWLLDPSSVLVGVRVVPDRNSGQGPHPAA